jgi:hypothetical protein
LVDDVSALEESPLLNAFFQQLTKTNEARRCINYLFKYKCERIDLSFLTMKNLQKIYLKYAEIHDQEEKKAREKEALLNQLNKRTMLKKIGAFFSSKNKTEELGQQTMPIESKDEESKSSALTQKHIKFLKSMFSSLMNIAEAIMQ